MGGRNVISKGPFFAGLAALGLVLTVMLSGCIVESVGAGELVVIQAPASGRLKWVTNPGWAFQGGGDVTVYQKRDIYHFEGVKVRFNDGGDAVLKGSVQYDMPTDTQNLNDLHSRYGNPENIKAQIIATVVNKVLYMTGPLMSSRESYAEKRTDLIRFVQDQIDAGVYRVVTRAQEIVDPLSGQKTVATVAVVAVENGQPVRQEKSIVAEFGIRTFNFTIEAIDYSEIVDKQIAQQQEATMSVQTAQANARRAEQDRITTEQQGQANAAKAKWEQETIKAKAIVEAEQARDVARLDVQSAEAYKQATLLRADADAEARRRLMNADGALAQKLATLEKINDMWSRAFGGSSQPLVPSVVFGAGSQATSVTSAQSLMDLFLVNQTRQLGVDLRPGGQK
jgi:regulator of protease activity HflC (stomatin/prohibitin superfamily)